MKLLNKYFVLAGATLVLLAAVAPDAQASSPDKKSKKSKHQSRRDAKKSRRPRRTGALGKMSGEHLVCGPCGVLARSHVGGALRWGRPGGVAVALA